MRRSPAFDLFQRIVEAHDGREGASSLAVVPVIISALAPIVPLLRGVTAYLDSAFYDASNSATDSPVDGTLDPVLKATVEASLTLRRPSGDLAVEVVQLPDGKIDARFRGKSAGSGGGERQVLALARALFSNDLRSRDLVVLAYDESLGMDRVAQRACWEFLAHLQGLRIGSVRSLVIVAGIGKLDYERHCARGSGFQYGLVNGELIRRRTDDVIQSAVAETVALASSHAVLFLGAGASASSGLPLGNWLRDNAIRRLLGSDTDDSKALCIEFRTFLDNQEHLLTTRERGLTFDRFVAELTLEQVVRVEKHLRNLPVQTLEEFSDLNDAAVTRPGVAIAAIRRMAAVATRRMVVVEVNFDTLLEHDEPSLFERFTTEEEFQGSSGRLGAEAYIGEYLAGRADRVPLLKVHGTIENRDSCVASIEETANGLPAVKEEALMSLVGDKDHRVPWLYVGASMRDRDLTASVFGKLAFAEGVRESWVAPIVAPSVASFVEAHREHAWGHGETLHSRSVTELADVFLRALADEWT